MTTSASRRERSPAWGSTHRHHVLRARRIEIVLDDDEDDFIDRERWGVDPNGLGDGAGALCRFLVMPSSIRPVWMPWRPTSRAVNSSPAKPLWYRGCVPICSASRPVEAGDEPAAAVGRVDRLRVGDRVDLIQPSVNDAKTLRRRPACRVGRARRCASRRGRWSGVRGRMTALPGRGRQSWVRQVGVDDDVVVAGHRERRPSATTCTCTGVHVPVGNGRARSMIEPVVQTTSPPTPALPSRPPWRPTRPPS